MVAKRILGTTDERDPPAGVDSQRVWQIYGDALCSRRSQSYQSSGSYTNGHLQGCSLNTVARSEPVTQSLFAEPPFRQPQAVADLRLLEGGYERLTQYLEAVPGKLPDMPLEYRRQAD